VRGQGKRPGETGRRIAIRCEIVLVRCVASTETFWIIFLEIPKMVSNLTVLSSFFKHSVKSLC
jgi:hypothetical protein